MTRTIEDMYPTTVGDSTLDAKRCLLSQTHTAAAPASVNIAHAQLRHLISCPSQRGTVYYVGGKSILERDLLNPASPPRCIIDIEFPPTCFAATAIGSNPTTILFAAGGYNSDLHLSLHAIPSGPQALSSPSGTSPASSKLIWRHSHRLRGRNEIVNSILFTPAILTDDTRRLPSDLRIAISGNDSAVKLFEIAILPNVKDEQRLQDCGNIKLETPVNHMSFSPDGRTLLCVGDTPKAYLFNISPGSTATFSPLAVYMLPPHPRVQTSASPTGPPANFSSQACFSTAWSADGLKFAVASQEGQLCVWDVRSANPLLNFWTPFRRNSLLAAAAGRGRMGEWEWEDLGAQMRPNDDATNNGPDSGIRNVRFSAGEGGRELLVFTEHTTNMHVIDARTFDPASHSVVRFPDLSFPLFSPTPSLAPTESRSPSPVIGIHRSSSERPDRSSVIIQRSRLPPMMDQRSRSRSRTPPGENEPLSMRSRSPPPDGFRDIVLGPRSRSRSRSRSPMIIIPRRSRSRSRSPPPVVIIPRGYSPPGLDTNIALGREDMHWMPAGSRVLMNADGDIIEGDGMVTDSMQPATRWPRHVGGTARTQMMRSFTTERSEGPMPLEAVAEGGEPPPPQKPTHLAGLCFDPSGGWVYVASESCIVEWRVREREEGRICWGSGAWA